MFVCFHVLLLIIVNCIKICFLPWEPHDVREEDCDLLEVLCIHVFLVFELVGHSLWEHLVQQAVGTPLLAIQLLCFVSQCKSVALDVICEFVDGAQQEWAHPYHNHYQQATHTDAWNAKIQQAQLAFWHCLPTDGASHFVQHRSGDWKHGGRASKSLTFWFSIDN